jgi:hypothetical protein
MFLNIKALNTAPVATEIADGNVAGANLNRVSSFPTKMVEMLAVNPDLKPLVRYFLTKASGGIVTLHAMLPYQRPSIRINPENGQANINRQTLFVAISCNKNEYDAKNTSVHVISENNLAMSELSFESNNTYNGIVVVGSPIENYIPYSKDSWTREHQGSTIGQIANNETLNIFFKLQDLSASLQNTEIEVDPEEVRNQMASLWARYEANEKTLIEKNFLVKSNLIYSDSNALAPVTTPFAFTTSSTNQYLDARRLFGSKEAGASYAPVISKVFASGVITPKEANEVTGYKYGQTGVTSKLGNVVIVPEDAKATTLETTTRELSVFDGSGRNTNIELTVNDISRNNKIVKRSTNLAELPVGSQVKVTGRLSVRVRQEKCLAVQFRISDVEWTTEGRSSHSDMNPDLNTSLENAEEMFASLDGIANEVENVEALKNEEAQPTAEATPNPNQDQPLQSETGGQAGF